MRGRASASSRPEFAIEWRGITELAPATATGMTEEEAGRAHRHDRPLLVYIYPDAASEEDEDPRVAVEEDRAFRDESVVVGARLFDCVRISKEDAREDRALKSHAGSAPCLVFVRPDFSPDRCLSGRFHAGRIFSAMHDTVEMDYENCLRQTLKQQGKLAEALVKVLQQGEALAEMDGKIAGQKDGPRRKQLEEKRAALAEEIRAAEETLKAQENALYELKPKQGT